MSKRIGMEVSIAIAEAVAACDVDAIAAYPITPQTHIVEHLSDLVASGELDAEYVPVESEHSAMSACCGMEAAGARTFTATSSQGLALMHEILFIASAMRLPMVMAVANRALSGPINIWNDHGDIMAERDIGWVQTFAENGQEALDLILHAFRVAEDPEVYLPVIVNFDGFIMSHVIEPMEMPSREEAMAYIPEFKRPFCLNPDAPVTLGPVGIPEVYTEVKYAQNQALLGSKKVVKKAFEEFKEKFGREYHVVEKYRADDADVIMVTMGSMTETAMSAVDEMRDAGDKVGLVRIRLWRPFPGEEMLEALKDAKVVLLIDRVPPAGAAAGPVASEIKGLLYGSDIHPKTKEFFVGLGGRDIRVSDIKGMFEKGKAILAGAPAGEAEVIGVRS